MSSSEIMQTMGGLNIDQDDSKGFKQDDTGSVKDINIDFKDNIISPEEILENNLKVILKAFIF